MTTAPLDHPGHAGAAKARSWPEALWTTIALSWLVVWLVVQTPVAVAAFQYGNLDPSSARLILLIKDVAVAGLLLVLFVRHYRGIRFAWYDWLALVYAAAVAIYAVVPWLLGSELPLMAVVASARIFLMPVELYALGRLAFAAGARADLVIDVFLGATAIAAAAMVASYLFLPQTFWETTYDLPAFIREVQGLPGARSLWDISILGHYGIGETGSFTRAVGPFTHPVGASHFFVVPLLLSAARAMRPVAAPSLLGRAVDIALVLVFTAAVIAPISRGSWIAAALGVLVCGFVMRRFLIAVVGVAVVGAFIALVPPFSLSVTSALSMSDSSVQGHAAAVEEGVDTITENPLGLGVGQADHLGSAYGGDASTGVGENMYLSTAVTAGPIGLVALVGWMIGLAVALWPGRGSEDWRRVALLGALAGFSVSAMTASGLMRFTTSAAFWLLIGLVVAPLVTAAGPSALRRVTPRRLRRG